MTRWRGLLKAQGVEAGRRYLLQSYMVGICFNNLLRSTIGGDAIRAYDTWKLNRSKAGAFAVIFIDRFLGALALAFLAVLAVFGAYKLPVAIPFLPVWIAAATLGLLAVFWALVRPPEWAHRWLDRIGRLLPGRIATVAGTVRAAFWDFRDARRSLGKAFGLSVLLQANVILHYYVLVKALAFAWLAFGLVLVQGMLGGVVYAARGR